MKFKLVFSTFLLVSSVCFVAQAQVKHVVIASVFGGGSNASALYQYDFIELYNPTSETQSLTNWSVQYSSAVSASWQKQSFTATIPSGGFILIQLSGNAAAPTGAVLPTPDVIGAINLSATTGKVALVNVNNVLSGTGIADTTVIDLVGYGGTASGYETMPAPAITSKKCLVRINNGCTDINDNSLDFTALTSYVPHNSASPASKCDVLPVKLQSFSATISKNEVTLHWRTVSELMNNSFVIEKSIDANNGFVTVGFIKSKGSISGSLYEYVVTINSLEKEYFRLKFVDNDGSIAYSNVVSGFSNKAKAEGFRLYPNPMINNLTINYPSAENGSTITISSFIGGVMIIKKLPIASKSISIDVSKLPNSVYYILLENNGLKSVSKFVKE